MEIAKLTEHCRKISRPKAATPLGEASSPEILVLVKLATREDRCLVGVLSLANRELGRQERGVA